MDEFAERQMLVASNMGEAADAANAEESVKLSRGQTPTVDADVYDPQQLRNAGYPLSNPTSQPNRYTKEHARTFAGRDSATGQPLEPTTPIPVEAEMLPSTRMYVDRNDTSLRGLTSAVGPEAISNNLSSIYSNMIHYTNSLVDEEVGIADEQSNRIRWNTSDRMETIGFNMLLDSERTDEGIDDKGLDGLQIVMSAQIMRGAKSFAEVSALVGDTGANEDQLIETWNKAAEAYQNAAQGIIDAVPETEEAALRDTRYIGALMTVLEASGSDLEELRQMTPEELMSKGKSLADFYKANLMGTGTAVYLAKQDPKVANAIMYMLEVDDALPTTMGDFGRHLGYGIMDPINFIGGAGIIAKIGTRVAGKSILRQALIKAGATGAIGAGTMGGYLGLHDVGMQNIALAAGIQEQYDPWRTGIQTAIGAGLGFLLGAAISGLTEGGAALLGRLRKPVSEAAEEFRDVPVPENIVPESEMMLRRDVKRFQDKLEAGDMSPQEFIDAVNEVAESADFGTFPSVEEIIASWKGDTSKAAYTLMHSYPKKNLVTGSDVELVKRLDLLENYTSGYGVSYKTNQTARRQGINSLNREIKKRKEAGTFDDSLLTETLDDTPLTDFPGMGKDIPDIPDITDELLLRKIKNIRRKPVTDISTIFSEMDPEEVLKIITADPYLAQFADAPEIFPITGTPGISETDLNPEVIARRKWKKEQRDPQTDAEIDAEIERLDAAKASILEGDMGNQSDPWIGVMDKDGNYEFRNQAEGREADWHHSMAMSEDMADAFDDDASLRFVRFGDAREIQIKGNSALDPMGKGKAQIRELAIKLKEEGMPGNFKIRVEEVGLHTDYEGQIIGTIDQWIKRR